MENYPSELRRGHLDHRWVLIASGRADRPQDYINHTPSKVRRDPFSPENIRKEDIIDLIPNNDGTEYETPSTWKAMAVRNLYPFVGKVAGRKPRSTGDIRDGVGAHEIIIHSPDPDRDFGSFESEQAQAVLELYLKRYNHLSHMPEVKHVQIFTNRGKEAGASVVHPHTQVVALPVVPPYIKDLVRIAGKHYDKSQSKLSEDEVEREIHEASRVIYENSKFLVYCPFAPLADYHIRIMPKERGSYFHEITQEQVEHLSRVLNLVFRRLDRIAGIPPYNAYIRTAPVGADEKRLRGFRWHIDILPHLAIPGGLEISTGLTVVTVFPEDAAHALRQDS
ncbi:MAG: HIT domain-containing protein [bacterium]|nr:HIT domain-containing protein [bacterium]MDZ4248288.1 HIT domain-containing protein [Patescibacteria group bacterium]